MGLFSKIKLKQILDPKPVSSKFGCDRGTPIDRYYIEKFLSDNHRLISGNVLEMGEDTYTRKFGSGVSSSTIFRFGELENGTQKDLCNPQSLQADTYDCFICTQTFNFIYDFRSAIAGSHSLLKPGGRLLATLAALAPVSEYDASRWGDYWRFTAQSARESFSNVFGKENVHVTAMGNSAAASLFIKGYALEDLGKRVELDYNDELFPLIIAVVAVK